MMLAWLPDIDRGYGDAYTRLADAIEGAIRSGRLKAGERLPTHRALARQLGVAISTVTRGYAEATDRGLLESTVGRGTFVRSAANASTARGPEMRPMERMYVSAVPEADIIDLSLNHPLREGAGKSLGDSLSAMIAGSDLDELSLYHPPHGNAEHRAAGSEWLRFMGVEADPGDVMVIAGGQTGLLSILLAFARRGDVVLSESLTWPGALAIAQSVGMRLESVEMDEEGIDPERFEEACKHFAPRLLYTMPTLQNPTTATASVGRRQEIVRIAREHGVLIVEDDAYGFILSPRVTSYWEIAPETSVYLTSLSKPIAPAMRIGYLAARAPHRRRLLGTLRATTVMPSPLLSELAARLIRSGEGAERANFQADAAFRRQRLADRILGPESGVPVSLHRWLPLPQGIRTSDFVASTLGQGVAVTPGDVFAVRPGDDPAAVRICLCAEPDEKRLERALTIIARLAEADRSAALPVV